MITFINLEADHVVGIRLDGRLNAREFEAVTSLIEQKLQDQAQLYIYIEITSLMGLTLSSMFEELKASLKNGHRIEKLAIVSDIWWFKNWNVFNEQPTNGLSLKTFSHNQKRNAIEWISYEQEIN